MQSTNKAVDAYIAKAQPFAQPVLSHLRKLIHQACPEVKETIKWGMPSFEYKGLMCGFAAFKQHCSFNLWKAALLKDVAVLNAGTTGMGILGKITSLKDLPKDKQIIGWVKEHMVLNEQGVKLPAKAPRKTVRKALVIPDYWMKALGENKKALAVFEAFSYSHRKEYVEWIVEAKRPETRQKRMDQALAWLAEGKGRNWQYEAKTK
jgi:hypothetical protein